MKSSKLTRLIQKLSDSQRDPPAEHLITNLNEEFAARIYGGRLPDTNANCTNGTCSNSLCSKLDAPKNTSCTNNHCTTSGMDNATCTNNTCNNGGIGEL